MIDAHCHLNFHSFEKDYDNVIKNAQTAGIKTIINAGTQIISSKKAVELARKYEKLFAVVGIHPHHADKLDPGWSEELEAIAKNPKVVGIGECGLDYYKYQSNGMVDPALQKNVFIKHIELAHELKLPLQIHSRDEKAREDILEILFAHKNLLQTVQGMLHCIAGSKETLKKILDLGFYVGFDGNITYKGIAAGEPIALTELVKYAPLERIVIETDSPYLTPIPYRGERNEPKYAILIGEYIAKIKHISFQKLEEQTDKNAYNLFKKM